MKPNRDDVLTVARLAGLWEQGSFTLTDFGQALGRARTAARLRLLALIELDVVYPIGRAVDSPAIRYGVEWTTLMARWPYLYAAALDVAQVTLT